jgi:hypothetical protein
MQIERQPKQEHKNRMKLPPLAFLVCLVLSAIAWFFINFSRDQEHTLEYKLIYSELPEGKKSCTFSDTTLLLTFNTRGLDYLTPEYAEENRIVNLSVKELVKNKNKRSAYSFSNKELCSFLVDNGYPDLISVEKPEVLTLYVK